MSFILDALKKSELERQRQSVPGLVDSGAARPRARLPVWAIALGSLLAVNLIVLLYVLTRGTGTAPGAVAPGTAATGTAATGAIAPGAAGPPPLRGAPAAVEAGAQAPVDTSGAAAPGAEAPGAEAHSPALAAQDGHFSPLDPPVYAPEVPAASITAPEAARPAGSLAAGNNRLRHRDPLLTDEDYKADDEVLPTINEINLTGAQALPELHLDVHVFATKAAERFVYVNMRKYREGATLQEGPGVERIRRDGVVLTYQGLRFLLPRQ
jgi:general secretion pathway protein B